MADLFQAARHVSPPNMRWDDGEARAAIAEIVEDALSHFEDAGWWPGHPLDGVPDGLAGIYLGASGVVWALEHLKRADAIAYSRDFLPVLPKLVAHDDFGMGETSLGAYGSLYMRDLGPLLLAMHLKPDAATADRICARISDNNALPVAELMWGTAGSMLACLFMHGWTGEPRFVDLYREQAARLLGELEEVDGCRLWTQGLYGRRSRWLGLVHGFAGNMFALLRGWDSLSADQQRIVADVSMQTLAATARRSELGANWPVNMLQPDAPMLAQICHGAPGILAASADAPFSTPEFEQLLRDAGALTWTAGPLRKGSNFCHGTGGNGFALLKLYQRTGDAIWLDRARAFGTAAIALVREARKEYGRGRYTLWTGDIGLAAVLWSFVQAKAEFPSLDA